LVTDHVVAAQIVTGAVILDGPVVDDIPPVAEPQGDLEILFCQKSGKVSQIY